MLAKGAPPPAPVGPVRKVRQVNLAADGEYVKDLLESGRYQKCVKENYERVDVAIIRYGANDSRFSTPEDFKKQTAALCDALKKDYPNITILMSTGTYLKGDADVNTKQYGPYWQATCFLARGRELYISSIAAMGNRELFGMPPAKEMVEGSAARLMRRRISDDRMFFALSENCIMICLQTSVNEICSSSHRNPRQQACVRLQTRQWCIRCRAGKNRQRAGSMRASGAA